MKDSQDNNESQKLMLDFIENLRKDLRGGIDNSAEQFQKGLLKNSESVQNRLDETLKLLNQQLHGMRKTMDNRMDENTKALNDRLDNASRVIHGVKEELGHMKEIGPQIKKLHEVLGSQKLRGNLGEQIMNDLISQVIPAVNYEFQYEIDTKSVVDAIIRTKNGIIPIDSKFPLENYRRILSTDDEKEKDLAQREFCRNVRKHLSDIHKKYVKPELGTLDFALMYVPADAVYFEIVVNNPDLSEYAKGKHVYIVSPSIFYSFLQVILLSFQSQQFEEHAKDVLRLIKGVKKESERFGENLSILNKHLTNAKVKMDDVNSGYDRLNGQISVVSGDTVLNNAPEPQKLSLEDSE